MKSVVETISINRKLLVLLSIAPLLGGCVGRESNPWKQLDHAESLLAETALKAAWTPDFLSSPEEFREMSPEQSTRLSRIISYSFADSFLGSGLRYYSIGDPTEHDTPPSRHCVVMLKRRADGSTQADRVSRENYFGQLFDFVARDGYDIRRDGLVETCNLYIKLFCCKYPASWELEVVLNSVADIPVSPQDPLPKEVSALVRGPVTQYAYVGGEDESHIRFEYRVQFWDSVLGDIKKEEFQVRYYPGKPGKTTVKIAERLVAKNVGRALGDR